MTDTTLPLIEASAERELLDIMLGLPPRPYLPEFIGPQGKFRFNGKATIGHLNVRKVGDENDRRLAVDVKLEAVAPFTAIFPFVDPLLAWSLFLEGTGAVANVSLGALSFGNKLQHYRVLAAGMEFVGAQLSKFAFAPKDRWQFTVSFSATFEPTEREVAILAEHLADDLRLAVEPSDLELIPPPQQGAA